MGLLPKLRVLDLSQNNFSGPIPANLKTRDLLDLSNNRLEGTIPSTLYNNAMTLSVYANPNLSGQVQDADFCAAGVSTVLWVDCTNIQADSTNGCSCCDDSRILCAEDIPAGAA